MQILQNCKELIRFYLNFFSETGNDVKWDSCYPINSAEILAGPQLQLITTPMHLHDDPVFPLLYTTMAAAM